MDLLSHLKLMEAADSGAAHWFLFFCLSFSACVQRKPTEHVAPARPRGGLPREHQAAMRSAPVAPEDDDTQRLGGRELMSHGHQEENKPDVRMNAGEKQHNAGAFCPLGTFFCSRCVRLLTCQSYQAPGFLLNTCRLLSFPIL